MIIELGSVTAKTHGGTGGVEPSPDCFNVGDAICQ